MNVVMVHGFANTGRLFRTLCRELGARGHVCHAPTFHPNDARLGIPDLSGKLASFVRDNIAAGSPVALVGFSMGALVVRHYLQALGGARSTRVFFSIAGPHQGTLNAYLFPGPGTRQMRPGSPFLLELNSGLAALGALPVFTYRTPFDLTVHPARTTRIPSAPELVALCPLHWMLPSDPAVVGHIAGVLQRLEPGAATVAEPLVL
jgi:triacylglycerol lipase